MSPASVTELVDVVRAHPRVVPVGAGTKARLARAGEEFLRVSTAKLSGIVDYEPSEFTFTALAGTPLREIVKALHERGQYLPFDPLFVQGGATLGGTVAAGVSGPGRFRFGGVRDFILGVQFVDGAGRVLRLGGKVVKNAAGFDLPKFFVGSAGRFGVLTEITFKVFPRPAAARTVRLEAPDFATKTRLLVALARGRWELEALDAAVEEGAVYARLGGPAEALDALANEILAQHRGSALTSGDADFFWSAIRECRWAHSGGGLAKVALTPAHVAEFGAAIRATAGARGWISAGGNVGYVSIAQGGTWPTGASPGITLRGDGPLWHGPRKNFAVMRAVKQALDPDGRFPLLDE